MDRSHHQGVSEGQTDVTTIGACVRLLRRPEGANALCEAVLDQLPRWASNPELYAVTISGDFTGVSAEERFEAESRVAWALETNPKPAVALIDGPLEDAGLPLALFGTHRVGGSAFSFKIDALNAGRWPAPGTLWFLSRLPPGRGAGLLLSGRTVDGEEARHLSILTHTIDAAQFGAIADDLSQAEPVDPVLDTRQIASEARAGELGMLHNAMADAFNLPTLVAIERALAQAGAPWARLAHAALVAGDPLQTSLAFELIRRARHTDLRTSLIQEWRVRQHWAARDARPLPTSLAAVERTMIDPYFAPLPTFDPALPPRPRDVIAAA